MTTLLQPKCSTFLQARKILTLFFSLSRSFSESVSAFAITGTMFTLLCIAFINSTSKGLRLKIKQGKSLIYFNINDQHQSGWEFLSLMMSLGLPGPDVEKHDWGPLTF